MAIPIANIPTSNSILTSFKTKRYHPIDCFYILANLDQKVSDGILSDYKL